MNPANTMLRSSHAAARSRSSLIHLTAADHKQGDAVTGCAQRRNGAEDHFWMFSPQELGRVQHHRLIQRQPISAPDLVTPSRGGVGSAMNRALSTAYGTSKIRPLRDT